LFWTGVLEDRPHFLRLWAGFLDEQRKSGSHVLPNLKNLYMCLEHFENYAAGRIRGGTVFYSPGDELEPVAVVMGGDRGIPDEWETDLGIMATLWGVYVEPEYRGQGIAIKLFRELFRVGLEQGIDSIDTCVLAGNQHGEEVAEAFGTQFYARQFIVSLQHPEILTNERARKGLDREIGGSGNG